MQIDETRTKILKVASQIFGKYGFQKSTIDEIARTAHKAKGSVYYYFSSKEDLFKAVVEEEIGLIRSGLTRILLENVDATIMMRNYLLRRMYLLKDAVNYHETLKADFNQEYEFMQDTREAFLKFETELLKAILDKGVRDQKFEIRDTIATASVIMMAMKAIEIPFYLQKKIGQYEQTVVELLNILIKGLGKA
jgi:AcrR family transcriptional regulator